VWLERHPSGYLNSGVSERHACEGGFRGGLTHALGAKHCAWLQSMDSPSKRPRILHARYVPSNTVEHAAILMDPEEARSFLDKVRKKWVQDAGPKKTKSSNTDRG